MGAGCKVYSALKMQIPVCVKLWTGDSSTSLKTLLMSLKSWVDQKFGGSRRLEPVSPAHRRAAAQSWSLYTRTIGRLLLLISSQNTLLHSVAFWPRSSEE